jgi:D-alanyl-D-alanine carboxypeptidase (penicillin-binding protein 5/6)
MLALMAFAISGQTYSGSALAQTFDTKAPHAVLMDAETGTILFTKDADVRIPPASLAKLMTMEVVFNRLKSGSLSLTDQFLVSENAWRTGGANSGGSTMFAKLKSEIALQDLIRGVIIQSANDGCIIIAEGMAGSEEAFSAIMNERARAIGLKDSFFTNSTGLPDERQYVSVNDLAKLAQHMIREYPEYYKYYSETEFEWNGILQRNRNPLLGMNINADGMKTGYTEASGYAIVGSAVRDGQRLITAMSGMTSTNERAEEARKILDWGFRAFERLNIFDEMDVVGSVGVYGGEVSAVDVTGKGPIEIYLPVGSRDKMQARVAYNYPLMPPIQKGDQVATLKIWIGDKLSQETPLYAMNDVGKGSLTRRATDALKELMTSWIPQ